MNWTQPFIDCMMSFVRSPSIDKLEVYSMLRANGYRDVCLSEVGSVLNQMITSSIHIPQYMINGIGKNDIALLRESVERIVIIMHKALFFVQCYKEIIGVENADRHLLDGIRNNCMIEDDVEICEIANVRATIIDKINTYVNAICR